MRINGCYYKGKVFVCKEEERGKCLKSTRINHQIKALVAFVSLLECVFVCLVSYFKEFFFSF